MTKKNIVERELQLALENYSCGNFYGARKYAREILASQANMPQSREQAAQILKMTRADPLVFGVGFLVLLFSLTSAYITAY
jgi:hypothetical protein